MDESELVFIIFYILFCMCVIYPPVEFQRLGLTIEQTFKSLLGDESLNFVQYHQRRTCLNLFAHASLPFIFFCIHELKFAQPNDNPTIEELLSPKAVLWSLIEKLSWLVLLTVLTVVINWSLQDSSRHPISKTLAKFSDNPDDYKRVATEINNEYRRPNVYTYRMNCISTVICTENWLIKTSPYKVYFAQQNNCTLTVESAETYELSPDTNDTLQMVKAVVKPTQLSVDSFNLRINALEWRNFEQHIRIPVTIPENVKFHKNVIDRFIEVFKEQVRKNPIVEVEEPTDKCFACMVADPNIKISKQCLDEDSEGRPLSSTKCCTNCNCRPMWCVDCLARWFSARQNENERGTWLEQKCTCPMCRAKFCILDVSYIRVISQNT